MKKLIFIAGLLISLTGMAQNKKDNTIILSGPVSMGDIKRVLFENGYSIIGNDTAYISTSAKGLPKYDIALKLMILKSDNTTQIKGLEKITLPGKLFENDEYESLYFGGMKGSFLRKAWEEMDKIAKQLSSNASITYAKQ